MSEIWTFDGIENKHDVYRGEYSVKKFCEFLKEHALKIMNFEKKKIVLFPNEQQKLKSQKSVTLSERKFEYKYNSDIFFCKVI